jgi:pheromone shutdown protein TraB
MKTGGIMPDIHVLFNMHKEWGKCNTVELYKKIEEISPEVIFEELDYSSFDEAYKGRQPFSVETYTITMYLQNHIIEHIPVDTYDTIEFTKEDKRYMDNLIFNNNDEYKKLINIQYNLSGQLGFDFLNSKQSVELTEMIKKQEELTVQNLNDEKLRHIYKIWISFYENRDNEMIRNIYNYSKERQYNKAMFLIGADHLYSIDKKIKEYKEGEVKINWIFSIKDLSTSS